MVKEYPVEIAGNTDAFDLGFEEIENKDGVQVFRFSLHSETAEELQPVTLKWNIPAQNVKGVWTTNALHVKRLKADWESPTVVSRVAVEAPVVALFSHDDANVQTFACSDVINTMELSARVREEDNLIYCEVKFFTEKMPKTKAYGAEIRIDSRPVLFSESLKGVSDWWASFDHLKPMEVFDDAKIPLYSTWYSYHQSITVDEVLTECKESAELDYKVLIVDDGWQTKDSNRGYDFAGDWQPERIPNIKEFVEEVHKLGMKFMLWYSVPACGKKSSAYKKFKGKFLTENNRWAPIFDPRYPEVRDYLINIYASALKDWNLDGFKLDFIDEFRVYPETELTKENGRDYSSVNEAVDRLMSDVMKTLRAIKPDVLIEFRQKYIGPAMRKYGNMFRAFDCPNDSVTNRIRTTDVKLLCGNTAVHSDMFTWNKEEPVELAALQMTNILFSVPQLSVRMENLPENYVRMIYFYSTYWMKNRAVLMDGKFIATSPLANYPLLSSAQGNKIIYGVYEDIVVEIDEAFDQIDLVNGKVKEQIVFELLSDLGMCEVQIYNCMGELDWESKEVFEEGVHALEVPVNGMICLQKIDEK